jgi:hypothetical protein
MTSAVLEKEGFNGFLRTVFKGFAARPNLINSSALRLEK